MKAAQQDTSLASRIAFWNAAGSIASASQSFIFLMVVTRVFGSADDYNIGYAIAQLMWTIGIFEATTYFATDSANRFSAENYLAFKILSCTLMVVVSIPYTLSFHLTPEVSAIALWLCAYKLVDAFASYFFAALQKAGRLDVSGFGVFWQYLLSTLAFVGTALISRSLLASIVAATLVEAAWIIPFYFSRLQRIAPIGAPTFDLRALSSLALELIPLFLATYLANYINNIPKYAINDYGQAGQQTVFNIVFMPSFVINLFLIFFLRPQLTILADRWHERDTRAFTNITLKLLASVFLIAAVVFVGSWLIGIPVLETVFSVNLTGELSALLITIAGGGIMSCANVLYNDIIIVRKQRLVLLAYGLTALVGYFAAKPLVSSLGVVGAALDYSLMALLLFVTYGVMFAFTVRQANEDSRTS